MKKDEGIVDAVLGTLQSGEVHPAAHSAMAFIKYYLTEEISHPLLLLEAFASTAISSNRLSEVCHETLRRIINGEAVSDRYLLGLAWTIKNMVEMKEVEDGSRKQ